MRGARMGAHESPRCLCRPRRAARPIINDVDRGGAINTIAPNGITSRNAVGQATSGYLVDVQKVTERDYQEWRAKDPEAFDDAFSRDYDPGCGQRFNGWVVGGME